MDRIGLLECIEAIKQGDTTFKTLKGVTLTSKDSFWCYRNFVIFDILIKNEKYKLKICLDNNEQSDAFYNNIDRCNTFYNDIFIDTTTLLDELIVYTNGITHKRHVAIIKNDINEITPNLQQYLNGYLELIKRVMKTNLVIDNFSLRWCVYSNDELKVTLEKGVVVLPNRLITPKLLIDFRSYLLSLIRYIITNYTTIDFNGFVEDTPSFNVENYNVNITNNDTSVPEDYKVIIDNIINSTSKDAGIEGLNQLIALNKTEPVIALPDNINLPKSAYITSKNVVGKIKENRIAIINNDGKIGFLNENSEIIIDYQYDTATDFEEGISVVSMNNKFGAIDKYGTTVVEFNYDDLEWCVNYNVYIIEKNELFGLISRIGDFVLECKFKWIDSFYYSRARYLNDKDLIGFIDPTGEIVIEAKWNDATSFVDGYANVKLKDTWYKIDINGETI